MSRSGATERATLETLNRQQRYLIQILCDAYNSPRAKGKLYEILQYYCRSQKVRSDFGNRLDQAEETIKSKIKGRGSLERIAELKRQIAEQDEAYAKLEKQLAQYNEKAKEYEDMLARNEQEKADLLASFQRHANGSKSESGASSKELELRAERLAAECEKMRKQSQDAKDLCHQIQDELERSNEECKTLQRQIHAAQEQLSGASSKTIDEEVLNRQIKEQERVIEGLNKDIDDANEEIAKLKRENQSLRDRLLHSD